MILAPCWTSLLFLLPLLSMFSTSEHSQPDRSTKEDVPGISFCTSDIYVCFAWFCWIYRGLLCPVWVHGFCFFVSIWCLRQWSLLLCLKISQWQFSIRADDAKAKSMTLFHPLICLPSLLLYHCSGTIDSPLHLLDLCPACLCLYFPISCSWH